MLLQWERLNVPHKLFLQLLPIAKDRIGAFMFYNERAKEKQSTFSERLSQQMVGRRGRFDWGVMQR